MTKQTDPYVHGHDDSMLRGHRWRTAENSAGYLLPELKPGVDLLDVGCGPGTITLDLAARVAPGRVVGLDREGTVLQEARRTQEQSGVNNAEFVSGDVYALDFDDGTFDVVHAHQVLQHLTEPVQALAEMRRVLRSGGVLAARDSDYGGFVWAPVDPLLDRWKEIFYAVSSRNGADANGGRKLLGWAHAAGFTDVRAGSSTWTFADSSSRQWFGGMWADRLKQSAFAEQAVSYGVSDWDELGEISRAWQRWASEDAGLFAMLHVEVLARA